MTNTLVKATCCPPYPTRHHVSSLFCNPYNSETRQGQTTSTFSCRRPLIVSLSYPFESECLRMSSCQLVQDTSAHSRRVYLPKLLTVLTTKSHSFHMASPYKCFIPRYTMRNRSNPFIHSHRFNYQKNKDHLLPGQVSFLYFNTKSVVQPRR